MNEKLSQKVNSFRQKLSGLDSRISELHKEIEGRSGDSLLRVEKLLNTIQNKRRRLCHRYALFRLKNALGVDREFIEESVLSEALLEFCSGTKDWAPPIPAENPISRSALTTLLLNPVQLGHIFGGGKVPDDPTRLLNPRSEAKLKLREWSSLLSNEPCIASILRKAQSMHNSFNDLLEELLREIDNLRVNYEVTRKGADSIRIRRDKSSFWVESLNSWESIEKRFPVESRSVLRKFCELELMVEELELLRSELNTWIRQFMKCAIAHLFGLLSKQERHIRRAYLGSAPCARRLCNYLLAEADRTDFLPHRAPGLSFPSVSVPDEISALRELAAYEPLRSSLERERIQRDSTVSA